MTERDYADDPALDPIEKQFSIVGTKDDELVRVHSEIGTVTRHLLSHPDATVEHTREVEGTTVAATVTLPRGAISIKSKPRQSDNWSHVVSGGVFDE